MRASPTSPPSPRLALLRSVTAGGLIWLVAVATAAAGEPEAARGLPPGVAPLGPESAAQLERLLAEAESYRGLEALSPIVAGVQSEAELGAQLAAELDEEISPEEFAAAERALEILGLIPEDLELRTALLSLLESEVAGYYDPRDDYLALVDDGGSENGEDAVFDAAIWVHEIVHALQDQHFDLERFLSDELISDAAIAQSALVEGDATLAMMSYELGFDFEILADEPGALAQIFDDPAVLEEFLGEDPGSRAMLEASAYLRENLLFPYLRGLTFAIELRRAGGQRLLDIAFSQEPPRSTEQVLHPEKYLDERDEPVHIELPDFSNLLPGSTAMLVGDVGELNIRLALDERLGTESGFDTAKAAAGWGGDRFALLQGEGLEALAWVTEWDDEEEAAEFLQAAAAAYPDWRRAASGTRVTLLWLDPEEHSSAAPLERALLEAPAERAAAPALDLAAVPPEDPPLHDGTDLGILVAVLAEPAIASGAKAELETADLTQLGLPNTEEVRQALGALLDALIELDGEVDIVRLYENPAVQRFRSLIESLEAPAITLEDGRFSIDDLGFSGLLPQGDGWRIVDPTELPWREGFAPIFAVSNPEHSAILGGMVRAQPPSAASALRTPEEWIAHDAVAEAKAHGGSVLGKRLIGEGRNQALEYQFRLPGREDDRELRCVLRVWVELDNAIILQAYAPEDAWEELSGPLLGALDSAHFGDQEDHDSPSEHEH